MWLSSRTSFPKLWILFSVQDPLFAHAPLVQSVQVEHEENIKDPQQRCPNEYCTKSAFWYFSHYKYYQLKLLTPVGFYTFKIVLKTKLHKRGFSSNELLRIRHNYIPTFMYIEIKTYVTTRYCCYRWIKWILRISLKRHKKDIKSGL